MDPTVLAALDAASFRTLLPDFLASNVDGMSAEDVRGFVNDWTSEDYTRLLQGLRELGDEYQIYRADPACRRLARQFMGQVITAVDVEGLERVVDCMHAGPTVIITNHISYIDALATDAAIASAGHEGLADKIAYLAGPKVYQDLFRLVAAAGIHTLPVPQSPLLGHTKQLSRRELARRAIASLKAGQGALEGGLSLLFYAEGSRTRTGRMGPFLQATRRYLKAAKFVIPAAIEGTDSIFGLDTHHIQPGPFSLRVAKPISLAGRDGRDVLVAAHGAIAALLPDDKRPDPQADVLL